MIICFYHKADLDGFCSAAIVKKRFPESKLVGVDYNDKFPWEEVLPGDTVYMCDFSLEPEDMVRMYLITDKDKFHWIDHHSSAIEKSKHISKVIKGIQSIDYAGCELTWQYLYPNEPTPLPVYLLGRYDNWDHEDPRVLPFQYRMRMERMNPIYNDAMEKWHGLFDESSRSFESFLREGEIIYKYQMRENRLYALTFAFPTSVKSPITGKTYSVLAVNKGHCNSMIFADYENRSAYDLLSAFCRTKDGVWKVSLWNNDANEALHDCGKLAGEIAQFHGMRGGGHVGAAGYITPVFPFPFDTTTQQ